MPVHRVAEEGFGTEAGAYERSRPSYPPEAVAWVVEHLAIASGRRVVDLAAGTGIFTRLLVPYGSTLAAVEPVAGMRDVLRAAVPGVPALAATAERLPFAAGSLDAITVAQAFHWFDAEVALAEMRRVLRVGGRFALLWNARDRSRDWVNRVWSVMDRVERDAPWRAHDSWRQSAWVDTPGFGPLHEAAFRHEQALTPDGVVERVKGVSHVAVLPPAEQQAVLDEVRAILAAHPDTAGREALHIPYRVDCYWAERLS